MRQAHRGRYLTGGLVLFQVGTEFVTPTEGWLDDPIDGAVTVPTVCPELPYVPCCAGAPGRALVFGVPAADVCALAANGAATSPSAMKAAMELLILFMADPFGRGPSAASAVRSSNRSCTEQPDNATRAKMCRNTIPLRRSTLREAISAEAIGCKGRPIASVSRSAPGKRAVTAFLSLVTARAAARLKPAHHIRME